MFMSMECTCVKVLEEVNKFMIVVHLPEEHQAMSLWQSAFYVIKLVDRVWPFVTHSLVILNWSKIVSKSILKWKRKHLL